MASGKYTVYYRIGFSSNFSKSFETLEQARRFIKKNSDKWTSYRLV